MIFERVLSKAFTIIIIIITAVIFSIAAFLAFRTFEKSAGTDIFSYNRSLEDRVRRAAAAEYRRYLFLLDVGKSLGENVDSEQIESRIESTAALFGDDGEITDMIQSVGYFRNGMPESAKEYIFKDEEWKPVKDVFNEKKTIHGWRYYSSDRKPSSGENFLAVANDRGDNTVFFRLDLDSFISSYVMEAVAALSSDFSVGWEWLSPKSTPDFMGNPPDSSIDNYDFKPFSIITGINRGGEPLYIEMLGFADLRWFMDRDENEVDDDKAPKPERSDFFDLRYFIKLTNENGAYYFDIEHEAAVNFFETLVILLIICLFVIMLFIQLQRTRLLRRKEKEFVASVTHELRTPLTVIRSAADNLSTGIVPPDKLKVYSGLISEQSERLGSMIEKILLYSRFEDKKKINEKAVEMDFNYLTIDLKNSLDPLSSVKGITLHWDTKGLPAKAMGFPEVMMLSVNNIVSNAVNHAYIDSPGDVRIRFRFLITDSLQIEIEDDGRGIEQREQKKIFTPFYRDSVSRSRQEPGSGLGLFIVKQRILMIGGNLKIESPYRRIDGSRPSGCRFTVTMPCKSEEHYNG